MNNGRAMADKLNLKQNIFINVNCVPKKSCPFLYDNSLYANRQDFLDIQSCKYICTLINTIILFINISD